MKENEKKNFWNGIFIGLLIEIITFAVILHIIQCICDFENNIINFKKNLKIEYSNI